MSRPPFLHTAVVVTLCLVISACSSPNRHYQDTGALEKPPQLEIIASHAEITAAQNQAEQRKNSTDLLKLMDDTHLLLRQPLGTAWKTLEAAIKQSGLTMVDKNLEKGFYYVNYDPAVFKNKREKNWLDAVDSMIFPDEKTPQSLYVISMRPQTDSIVIHTILIEAVKTDTGSSAADASVQLLAVLQKALQDELSPAESSMRDFSEGSSEHHSQQRRRR